MALVGKVCLVTGASRGIGKGIAKALTADGATVYITGRNAETLHATSSEIGGKAIPVICDHSDDSAIEGLFKQIERENDGQLDFLVNNCFAAVMTLLGKESDKPINKFWEQDPQIWDTVNGVGLRANYIASVYAGKLMVPRGSGIIVNMSSAGGLSYAINAAYSIGKAAQDRMAQDFNEELKGTGVKALSIWPGGVKTELMKEHILNNDDDDVNTTLLKNMITSGQTIDWVGRTVAALLTDKNIDKKAGRVNWCYDIADEFNILENDGTTVPSHRSFKSILMLSGHTRAAKRIPSCIKLPSVIYKWLLWAKGNKF